MSEAADRTTMKIDIVGAKNRRGIGVDDCKKGRGEVLVHLLYELGPNPDNIVNLTRCKSTVLNNIHFTVLYI